MIEFKNCIDNCFHCNKNFYEKEEKTDENSFFRSQVRIACPMYFFLVIRTKKKNYSKSLCV